MDIVRELVQSIVVIVVLAIFLEMLLPASDMRRYLRLVFGILVMIAVLQAVFSLINKAEFAFDVPAILAPADTGAAAADTSLQLQDIMDEGARLYSNEQQKAIAEYKEGLASQISSLASLSGTVRVCEVIVTVEENKQNPDYGQLKEVSVVLDQGGSGGSGENAGSLDHQSITLDIEPVEVRVGDWDDGNAMAPVIGGSNPEPEVAERIKSGVAGFYNLPPEKIWVVYK